MLQSTKSRYRPLIASLLKPYTGEETQNIPFRIEGFSGRSETAIVDGEALMNSLIADQMVEHEISHIEL